MPNFVYIAGAILLLMTAFIVDVRARAKQKLADPECVQHLIDNYIHRRKYGPLVEFPLRVYLELNQKAKYEQMRTDGKSLFAIYEAITQDAGAFVEQQIKNFTSLTDGELTQDEQQYYTLMEQRQLTPRACIAAFFQVPWSMLTEQEYDGGFYITNAENGHVFKVPFKEFDEWENWRILEIDHERRPFATHLIMGDELEYLIRSRGEFVTEMKQPPEKFILGPF
jgi:hypothetical protein